jgi:hypothetical protein
MKTAFSLFVALILALSSEAESFPNPDFAKECVAGTAPTKVLVFADPEGKGWHSYKSLETVPPLELGFGMAVQVWLGKENLYVRSTAYGEDHGTFIDYCFGPDRNLKVADWSVRTAWGWGFRPVKVGASSLYWFDTARDTEAEIDRPESAGDDLVVELTPKITQRLDDLPFFKLIPKKTNAPSH